MQGRILIIGSGTGGTLTANLLATSLKKSIQQKKVSIKVIADNDIHVFQPGNLEVAFRGADPNEFIRKESYLLDKNIEFIIDGAAHIDLDKKIVTTKSGNEIAYDYIIIATGSVAAPERIEGLGDRALNFHTGPKESVKIWEALQNFKEGKIVVAVAGLPHKCPPTPDEAVFLLDEFYRKRKIRNNVKIELVTPYPRSYPAEPIAKIIDPLLKKKGIGVISFFNVSRVDQSKHRLYSLEGDETTYDLLIVIPPHIGAKVIRDSNIGDKDGWVPTDKQTMNVIGYKDAFAIGDATNIPVSKTGVVAHLESEVVSKNIVSLLSGSNKLLAYNGRINCPMEVGDDKALFVSATYTTPVKPQKPSIVSYTMKKSFGVMYWDVLSGKFEWVLKIYFGHTEFPFKKDNKNS